MQFWSDRNLTAMKALADNSNIKFQRSEKSGMSVFYNGMDIRALSVVATFEKRWSRSYRLKNTQKNTTRVGAVFNRVVENTNSLVF